MRTEKELKSAKRALIVKAVAEFYEQVEEEGISEISLALNFNEYNMGFKIDKSYKREFQNENN